MSVYQAVATVRIPINTYYTCAFCDKNNEDRKQVLVVRGESGSAFSRDNRLTAAADMEAKGRAANVLSEISNGDFRHAYLTCECSSCHKRQPWAHFIAKKDWMTQAFAIGAFVVIIWLIFMIVVPDKVTLPVGAVIICGVLTLPYLFIMLHNAIWVKRTQGVNPKYLPRIEIKTPNN